MTVNEYAVACAAVPFNYPFIDQSSLYTLAPTIFSAALCAQIETNLAKLHPDLELWKLDESLNITGKHNVIIGRTSAAMYPKIAKWELLVKGLAALSNLTANDLAQNWNRTRDGNGRKDGGTTTDGSASRNSFNSDTMVPVSSSTVTATSGEMYSDHEAETGVQGRSKAETIAAFLNSIEWCSVQQEIIDTILSAVTLSVYE